MICLCRRQSVAVSTCDKSQITVATNNGSLKHPAWFMLHWDSHNSFYVWIERSHINSDYQRWQFIWTVSHRDRWGWTNTFHPFFIFFFLEYSVKLFLWFTFKNQIKCKFVPKQQQKHTPSSSIWRTECFASLFMVLN